MAEVFQRVVDAVTVTADDGVDSPVYTCPADTTAIVIHCQIANVDGTSAADVNIDLYDGTEARAVVSTLSVPADSAVNPVGGKLVLKANDVLRCWASADGDLELTLGILEIT